MGSKQTQIPVLLMTEEQKRLLVKPESVVDESSRYHLSKPYYNHKTGQWSQKKVHQTHSEKQQTYKKELAKMGESFSFKSFINEFSEINPESQYTPAADVKTNKSKMDAVDFGKPKYTQPKDINKAFALFIQADPISA
jgi:hypothetical protein